MRMHGANTIYCTVDGWVYHYRRQPIRDVAASEETRTNMILPIEDPTVVWEGHCLFRKKEKS